MTSTGVTYNHKNSQFWQLDFTGKERDPETGYSYFGARYLDHTPLTLWLSVDPMADKYPYISPYAYCAWNPLKLVDPDGDSIAVLYSKGAMGEGHMGILIQNEKGQWNLYSENGRDWPVVGSITGTPNDYPKGDEGTDQTYRSVQDFLDNQQANTRKHDGENYPYYERAFIIPTTQEEDAVIRAGMMEAMQKYRLLTDNCAQAVVYALQKAGVLSTQEKNPKRIQQSFLSLAITPRAYVIQNVVRTTLVVRNNALPGVLYNYIKKAHEKDGTEILR